MDNTPNIVDQNKEKEKIEEKEDKAAGEEEDKASGEEEDKAAGEEEDKAAEEERKKRELQDKEAGEEERKKRELQDKEEGEGEEEGEEERKKKELEEVTTTKTSLFSRLKQLGSLISISSKDKATKLKDFIKKDRGILSYLKGIFKKEKNTDVIDADDATAKVVSNPSFVQQQIEETISFKIDSTKDTLINMQFVKHVDDTKGTTSYALVNYNGSIVPTINDLDQNKEYNADSTIANSKTKGGAKRSRKYKKNNGNKTKRVRFTRKPMMNGGRRHTKRRK